MTSRALLLALAFTCLTACENPVAGSDAGATSDAGVSLRDAFVAPVDAPMMPGRCEEPLPPTPSRVLTSFQNRAFRRLSALDSCRAPKRARPSRNQKTEEARMIRSEPPAITLSRTTRCSSHAPAQGASFRERGESAERERAGMDADLSVRPRRVPRAGGALRAV